MTISERVTDLWSMTEALLTASPHIDYPRAKERAINDAVANLYYTEQLLDVRPIPSVVEIEAENSPITEQYLASATVLLLLPLARDYYLQDRLSKSVSAGVGGSYSAGYMNKVDELDRLDQTLRRGMIEMYTKIEYIQTPTVLARPRAPITSWPANRVLDPLANYAARQNLGHRRTW
jgi:hypothetical protein